MDSGDESNNRLKAPDSGFSGFRNQTFPNLFQGFFGVKHGPSSTTDLTSAGFADKPTEVKSLETIVSPSHDESWIVSHFLQAKREQEDAKNLQRKVTWSELGKSDQPPMRSSASSASFTDVTRVELVPVPRIHVSDDESSGNELSEKSESKPKVVVAKNYQKNILSSFLSHDLPHFEERQHQVTTRETQVTASVTGETSGLGDRPDGGLLPGAMESKQTLRDFLWNFNHEKINVSKKEMNLIASIDQ